jgi:hypothetical protein
VVSVGVRWMVDGTAGSIERTETRSLRSLQSVLVRCLGELIRYAYSRGYELTLGEAYVQSPRTCEYTLEVRCAQCGKSQEARGKGFAFDRVHMPSSLHYTRLAIDLNLFVRGEFVRNGDHFAWVDLGNYWEHLDPACRWGGRFQDANHLSVTFMGRK